MADNQQSDHDNGSGDNSGNSGSGGSSGNNGSGGGGGGGGAGKGGSGGGDPIDWNNPDGWKKPDMPSDSPARIEFIKRHLSQMSEYFDTVQIVATRLLPNGETEQYAFGSGNMYARIGSVGSWLKG